MAEADTFSRVPDDAESARSPHKVPRAEPRSANWSLVSILVAAVITIGAFVVAIIIAVGVYRAVDVLEKLEDLETASLNRNQCTGQESRHLMVDICHHPNHTDNCFSMIENVESFALLESQETIFANISALEPQPGPVRYWAVDEGSDDELSHFGSSTAATASFFSNNAYYYSVKAHRESVDCGGFSISLWRTLDGEEEFQLAYCVRAAGTVRICGGFELEPRDHLF